MLIDSLAIVDETASSDSGSAAFQLHRHHLLTFHPNMADEFDDLLDDFGRKPTLAKRLFYFLMSLATVATTAFLFIRIFLVDISSSQVTLAIATILSSIFLSFSYHNLAFAKAARIRPTASPPTKGAFKGKTTEYRAALSKFDASIADAAFWYSFAYNNAIFMIVAPLLGVYLLSEKLSGDLNLLVSGAIAAGLALFNSDTALKAIGE